MWSAIKELALHDGVIGLPSQTGTGTDDLTVSGKPYFAASRTYRVQIDSASETFKWSNDGGSTWEATGISISDTTGYDGYELKNAENEAEGIVIKFGSAAGHVNGDYWDFTTTGTVVQNSATAVGDLRVNSGSCEGLILRGEYVKGNEDGLQLYVVKPRTYNSSVLNRSGRNLDLGNGGLQYKAEFLELVASGSFIYRVDLMGIQYFKVYQMRKGSTSATGLFTCFAETYKTYR